jgi:hypothetical protein
MGGVSKRIKSLAAGGALIALALVAGCGSPKDVQSDEPASSVTAGAASNAPDPTPSDPAIADVASTQALPTPPASSITGATLCAAGERASFSCEIGAKRVSVCGAASGAIYRYGTPDHVELMLRRVTFAHRGYAAGGESQLTANNGDYTYTVFDSTVRTSFDESGNDPDFSSGLVIARGGHVISSKPCNGAPALNTDTRRALPSGSFVEH